MQTQVTHLWREAMRLSLLEKMEFFEKLIHQIKIEEKQSEQKNLNWLHLICYLLRCNLDKKQCGWWLTFAHVGL